MLVARRIVALFLALAALAFLAVNSRVGDADVYNSAIDRSRRLRELSGRLDRAALQAQALTMQDYDALTETLAEMRAVQRQLEEHVHTLADPQVDRDIAATRQLLASKEGLIEALLTANSVYRNSSAYLPRAVSSALQVERSRSVATLLDRRLALLLSDLLSYRIRRGAVEMVRFQEALAALKGDAALAGEVPARYLETIVQHGTIVATFGPKVDATIQALLATDDWRYDRLFQALRGRQDAAIHRANNFRAGLLALSVLLLVAVVAMFVRLRRNANALRRALSDLASLNRDLEVRVLARTHELASSKEQYRVLLETTQAVPWEMTPGELRFAYVGPQAAAVLGYPATDWLAKDFLADRLDPADREQSLKALTELSSRQGHHEIELRMRAADGRTIWFRCLLSVSASAGTVPVLRGILLDLTVQRQLELELRSAQKLESVGRLASGIAHEINTPVQFVSDSVHFITEAFSGMTGVLAAYRQLAATADEPQAFETLAAQVGEVRACELASDLDYSLENVPGALSACRDGLERIATIVRSMKEFAHPDQREMTSIDLNHNVVSTLTIARSEYKHVADLVTELGELPLVQCHPGEINQVVLNIVVNAAHAIGDRAEESGRRGRITVRTQRQDEAVVISIADTGGGIPTAIRERIFDPFFTTKEVGRGTGQGLAIARSVVERHGGRLSFESESGVGTTFFIRLPLAAGTPQDLTAAA